MSLKIISTYPVLFSTIGWDKRWNSPNLQKECFHASFFLPASPIIGTQASEPACRLYPARRFIFNSDAQTKQIAIKLINTSDTCKTKIAHWELKNIKLQSHVSDAYLKVKNQWHDTCRLNDILYTWQSFLRTTINTEVVVLAVHSWETFIVFSSRFLWDECCFSLYEYRFSQYEYRFSRYVSLDTVVTYIWSVL